MTFSAVKATKFIANIGFVLLFPGFLLYHFSLAALGLPPFWEVCLGLHPQRW